MELHWHIICRKTAVPRIGKILPHAPASKPYWKAPECVELICSCLEERTEPEILDLCRRISGMDQITIDRQSAGTEYACYAALEEISSGEKAFAVCFVDIKENEL
ncbi:MAG: hypothetical protein IJ960_10245 [Oscillospiraceae bacterium]|nr:hypothetical protein [Oscillospiraceae bacterium]MBR6594965.1 hypothetical protein [Oscillospiraceae bacterium]